MSDTDKQTDEEKFNQTLKRMLEMPPKPHKPPDRNDKKSGDGSPKGKAKQRKERR